MKTLAYIFPAFLALAACSADVQDENVGSNDAALTSFTAAQCQTPNVATQPKKDASGQEIPGTAKTTLSGCIVGKANETGAGVITRSVALLGNNAKLGAMTDGNDQPMFTEFTPVGPPSGQLATGQTQDVDVVLNGDFDPKGRLRFTRKLNADGTYNISIVNITPIKVAILFFPVTGIETGNLKMDSKLTPQANGITVVGTSEVQLEQNQEQAAQSSTLVSDVFAWLTEELAR